MTKQEFDDLKKESVTYKYNSFEYLEYENVQNYKLIKKDESILLIYGENSEIGCFGVSWAANAANDLVSAVKRLGPNVLISFIPAKWKDYFNENGFSDYAIFRGYWIQDITKIKGYGDYNLLQEKECKQASEVTLSCRNQSRGFHGESEEGIRSWIKGENPNAKDCNSRHCSILIHKELYKIVGIALVAVYDYDSTNGPVLWLREIAVHPDYQGKGIGRKLILQSIKFGEEREAKRAFLMADDCNENAIGLYKSVGFVPDDDVEINLVSG